MLQVATPESVGISSKVVKKFIEKIEKRGLASHSMLFVRGDKIFGEAYWKPFHKDFLHRMYSQTKSYVSVAIGLLEEEGKLNLDDKIADHFRDRIDGELHPYIENQTIREMLMMVTSCKPINWFYAKEDDRVRCYFNDSTFDHPAGTLFDYDSAGSQVLSALAEKISCKPLFEYLKEKIFNKLGTFKTATILQAPCNQAWGDSALVCTTRDMASFGRFVMNYGTWEGERLMNEEYLRKATSNLVHDTVSGHMDCISEGYGYQIWRISGNGFAFLGMGQQLTLMWPDKDFMFVCTSDNQMGKYPYSLTIAYLIDDILEVFEDKPLPEDKEAYEDLLRYCDTLELRSIKGNKTSSWVEKINGKTFKPTTENKQGIKEFSFEFFDDETGVFKYVNEQGYKEIPFGLNKNVFGKFPELGYSDTVGKIKTTNGFKYDMAVSGAWMSEHIFQFFVQIIDKYFGNMTANFGFKGDLVYVKMVKFAEAFMDEYEGDFVAKME